MSDVSFLNNNFGTATVISFNNGFLGSASFFRLKAVNNQCGMFLYAKGGTPPYGPMIFDTLLIQYPIHFFFFFFFLFFFFKKKMNISSSKGTQHLKELLPPLH